MARAANAAPAATATTASDAAAQRRRGRRVTRGFAVTVEASGASPGSVAAPPGAAAPRATIRSGSEGTVPAIAARAARARSPADGKRASSGLAHRPRHDRVERGLDVRAPARGARRRLGELRPQLRLVALALERHVAR